MAASRKMAKYSNLAGWQLNTLFPIAVESRGLSRLSHQEGSP